MDALGPPCRWHIPNYQTVTSEECPTLPTQVLLLNSWYKHNTMSATETHVNRFLGKNKKCFTVGDQMASLWRQPTLSARQCTKDIKYYRVTLKLHIKHHCNIIRIYQNYVFLFFYYIYAVVTLSLWGMHHGHGNIWVGEASNKCSTFRLLIEF